MEMLSGYIVGDNGLVQGYVSVENGMITSVKEGVYDGETIAYGLIIPPMVNSHTHCADHGLKIDPGMTVEELVAPPDGMKHQYLRSISSDELKKNMTDFVSTAYSNGVGAFIDFREGGEEGCRALRDVAPHATILGRPISDEYDPEEISGILAIADGIGLPSISDMDHRYIENVADQTREEGKIFAIHASERIREDIDLVLSLDPKFIVHMAQATDSDLLKCAEQEVPVVVCARSNRYFGIVPPIKRMIDCGVDVAIGTDNAMLCGPDMRSEAAVFGEILASQGGNFNDVLDCMVKNGRKILYPHNKIILSERTPADLVVLPCSPGDDVEHILRSKRHIFRYGPGKGE